MHYRLHNLVDGAFQYYFCHFTNETILKACDP